MIKRLRIQFVCVIMVIVMLLSGGILGVVIHFTDTSMEMQSISTMQTILSSPNRGMLGRPSDAIRTPYFTVQVTRWGELVATSSGYFDLSDEEYVKQVVNAALVTDKETGELPQYALRYLKSHSPTGYTIVFTDTATEAATLRQLFFNCLLIFCVAMVLFLGVSVLLSHWVIRPVEKAWDQQRQFVSDASHELKTPLSVIMANAELMQSDDTPEEDRRKFSKAILSMTYQMRSLVESLLEMARVDNGAVKTHMSTVDLSQLVSDAVLSVQLLYAEKGLGLRSRIAEGVSLQGSEQHLFQLLDVLLDNALKYSIPNGLVSVELMQSGRSCLLTVSNQGEPIAKEDLKNIFKRFYRADKARAIGGGYGLGLSIAEGIVEVHKGKIWAESKDGLNTFHVQLPL